MPSDEELKRLKREEDPKYESMGINDALKPKPMLVLRNLPAVLGGFAFIGLEYVGIMFVIAGMIGGDFVSIGLGLAWFVTFPLFVTEVLG